MPDSWTRLLFQLSPARRHSKYARAWRTRGGLIGETTFVVTFTRRLYGAKFIVVRLVQNAQASYTAWPVFVAGLITAAYLGLVVGILLYVPRHKL